MKALILKEYNTPFHMEEIEKPTPAEGQVLVRIIASGVNPLDLKIKSGQAAHAKTLLPAILGIDMAGVVEAVGRGVDDFKAGDEVYGMVGGIAGVPGTLAEYVAADAALLALKPQNISLREAAALPLVAITAWEGLIDRAAVKTGQKVLIQGGAGGVGRIATQLAIAMGSDVYATVSRGQFGTTEYYGATPIDYNESSTNYMERYTAGEGFDVVFDTVGGAVLDTSFGLARRYTGHVVSILGWGNHSLAPLSFRGATYSGVFTLYPLISGQGRAAHGNILSKVATLAEEGLVKVICDLRRYRLEDTEEAYKSIASGNATGKVVIELAL